MFKHGTLRYVTIEAAFPNVRGPFVSIKEIGHKGSTTAKFKKYHFWSRTELIIGLHDVVFHGEDARNVQKCVTLQNNMKNLEKHSENLEKIRTENVFGSRKMKCCESSETRFPKV